MNEKTIAKEAKRLKFAPELLPIPKSLKLYPLKEGYVPYLRATLVVPFALEGFHYYSIPHVLLESSQCKERGFLGRGKSLCPGNIESFVGSVALQRAHQLGALQVPHLDRPILTTTGEQLTIGADLEGVDSSLMRLSHRQALSALRLPPAQTSIILSTHQLISTHIPHDGRDRMGLPFKGAHMFPTASIPEKQFSGASASTPTGEQGAVGTPGHRRDITAVLLERLEQRPIAGLPQTDGAVIPTTGQAGAIRAPRQAPDKGQMRTTDPNATSGGHLPDLHPIPIATSGQQMPIGTPRHTKELGIEVVRIPQDVRTGSRDRIPKLNSIFPPSTRQELAIRTPSDPSHDPTMSMQRPGQRLCLHIPERHQHIGSDTGQLFPIRTPCHIVVSACIALDDAHAVSALHVPHSQGPIFTATEQAAAIGREGDTIHRRGMPLQPHSVAASLGIPEPNHGIKASAGHCTPIRAPGHRS